MSSVSNHGKEMLGKTDIQSTERIKLTGESLIWAVRHCDPCVSYKLHQYFFCTWQKSLIVDNNEHNSHFAILAFLVDLKYKLIVHLISSISLSQYFSNFTFHSYKGEQV